MKLVIDRSALLKSLGHVQSVVERRGTIPILSNVKLEAAGDMLHLTRFMTSYASFLKGRRWKLHVFQMPPRPPFAQALRVFHSAPYQSRISP